MSVLIDPHIAVLAKLHPQSALNYIAALQGIDAILAPTMPLPAIDDPDLETVGENQADGQLDMADSILEPTARPQIELDNTPLTPDEIAYGQRIADDPTIWDAPTVPLPTLAKNAEVHFDDFPPQIEAETSVMSDGVGDASAVGESDVRDFHKPSTSKHGRKRTPKAVQIVLDYLMTHPADARLSTNVLTDKLKCDVRIKVGRSSVGKALSIVRANGQH